MSPFRAFFTFLGILAVGAVMFYLGRIGFIEQSKPIAEQTSNEDLSDNISDLSDEERKNLDYFFDAIDTEKGEITPGVPENEWQRDVASAGDEIQSIMSEMEKGLSTLGRHEFESSHDFRDKQNVIALRKNSKAYWKIKKDYYDQVDQLYQNNTKKRGEKKKANPAQMFERLEQKNVETLMALYDFVIQNHERMSFEDDEVLLETDEMVQRFNTLLDENIKAYDELTSTHSQYGELVLGGFNALKKEMKDED